MAEATSVGSECVTPDGEPDRLNPSDQLNADLALMPPPPAVLENDQMLVWVDTATGDLSRVFDKVAQQEVLSGAGNQLQAFVDPHKYWDAWNIDPNYEQNPLPPSQLQSWQWIERGALRQRLRVTRTLASSTLQQDYVLDFASSVLRIDTIADWQDYHLILKAAFPLNWQASAATYEIPCGAIQRPTHSDDPRQQAKWEVPALQWADLTDDRGQYGASVLNDCKYGYDSKPSQLRLTLLRGSCWPDPEADRGRHVFTYALYPHRGDWQAAHTVRRGYELNQPLTIVVPESPTSLLPKPSDPQSHPLPTTARLIDCSAPNLVLMALTPAQAYSDRWILRCYEAQGQPARLDLLSDLLIHLGDRVTILEQPYITPGSDCAGTDLSPSHVSIQPWQIASVVIHRS